MIKWKTWKPVGETTFLQPDHGTSRWNIDMIQRGIVARTIKTLGKTIHFHIPPSYHSIGDSGFTRFLMIVWKGLWNQAEMKILGSWCGSHHAAARSLWRLGNKNIVIGKWYQGNLPCKALGTNGETTFSWLSMVRTFLWVILSWRAECTYTPAKVNRNAANSCPGFYETSENHVIYDYISNLIYPPTQLVR